MADTNEERLLNDLLREVGAVDAHVGGAHLESRVLAAWDTRKTRRKPDTRYFIYGAAAIVALAVMLPTSRPASAPSATAGKPVTPLAPVAPFAPVAPVAPFAPIAPAVRVAPIEAIELAGPFQIIRVQMPRSSLGMLMSPLEHPSEMIEADVLLGEDGMARAIHVSTNGSVYPWRSR